MRSETRDLNAPVAPWMPPPRPPEDLVLEGRYSRLCSLGLELAEPLHSAFRNAPEVWRYMPYGPFEDAAAYGRWIELSATTDDPRFLAIYDRDQSAWLGVASYLRISPEAGSIEVGHIALSPALQRTRAATEAMYLMMQWAFEAGYRRYEWKCNALNRASRRAAQRFGFSFEGVFRQATVVKGRNRDTAWFAAIDVEWQDLRAAYEEWLSKDNFDEQGQQKTSLAGLTRTILVQTDPSLSD